MIVIRKLFPTVRIVIVGKVQMYLPVPLLPFLITPVFVLSGYLDYIPFR